MPYDFNNAEKQQSFDLIPAGTICRLSMDVTAGGVGEDGFLTASRTSDAQYFNCVFTVCEGPYTRKKIFENIGWSGGKLNEKGESVYGNMGRAKLRAILESARGVHPDDHSPAGNSGRSLQSWFDLKGLMFLAKIGVEKGTGGYQDKNKIMAVVTPDMKEYQAAGTVMAPPVAPPWQQTAPPPVASSPVPAWAR